MPIQRKEDTMARYDREFLVPYLEDICVLHLSKQKLFRLIESSKKEIERINARALSNVEAPKLEKYKEDTDTDGLGVGCLGTMLCGLALVVFLIMLFANVFMAIILMILIGLPGLYLVIKMFTAVDEENEEIKKRNDAKELDHAMSEMAALAIVEPQTAAVKKRIKTFETEIQKIDTLLDKLYSVNIIPRWYRDLYPAVYLYDWFSNSRADDLDIALNTLVLEQIKDKLDVIIRNQGEMIISQRLMIANQRKSIDQMERHHSEMIRKLNQIGASVEDQKMYLAMIEANTLANAFFTSANYLKR